MKRSNLGRLLAGALVLTGAAGAQAQEPSSPETGLLPAGHRLSLYSRAGGVIYLSDARTAGGLGGGVGVRDTIQERFILQADLNYLMMLGNAGALRLGAGIQRSGTYTPAVLVTLTTLVGKQLTFLTPEHPTPVRAPAVALGVSVAPLRFTQDGLQLSLLELGVGAGTELPGLGLAWQLGLVEVGTSF
jgi:hypothetical protein